ncbi:MAG: SDR family oxidoreductase, partial [Rhodobacteraceae bacterium]|nr:SDR family oxidoreductase [Paracoccaceae bacterium]
MPLRGKVALVTGAGSGIGLDLARGLAECGCRVVLGDVRGAPGAAEALRTQGHEALGAVMDVTRDDDIAATLQAAQQAFGGLDVLVNNAGLFTTISRAPFEDLSLEEWERVFAVNVTGVFRVARAALPLLKASGAGRIVNITSATVHSAPPNMLHYVATKGALTAMTRSMARELGAYGITVNAIA